MKRILIALLLVILGAAGALFVTGRRPSGGTTPSHLTLLPRSQGVQFSWPNNQAWTWTFPLPQGGSSSSGISLRVRERTSPLAPNEISVVRSSSAAMPASQATRSFGTGRVITAPDVATDPGTATLQLLDLSSIGAASTRPGQSLRLIGQLRVGGAETPLFGDNIYLPAGHFAGTSVANEGTWANNELYLMTFYVRGETSVSQCDVFLQAGEDDHR